MKETNEISFNTIPDYHSSIYNYIVRSVFISRPIYTHSTRYTQQTFYAFHLTSLKRHLDTSRSIKYIIQRCSTVWHMQRQTAVKKRLFI